MTLEERRTQFKEVKEQNQQLALDSRKKLKVTGVAEVENFSDNAIEIDTCLGRLTVKGENLKISKLNIDDGELSVDGNINSLEYTKKKEKGGFFENIFR